LVTVCVTEKVTEDVELMDDVTVWDTVMVDDKHRDTVTVGEAQGLGVEMPVVGMGEEVYVTEGVLEGDREGVEVTELVIVSVTVKDKEVVEV
jgi:hypothetical protein